MKVVLSEAEVREILIEHLRQKYSNMVFTNPVPEYQAEGQYDEQQVYFNGYSVDAAKKE